MRGGFWLISSVSVGRELEHISRINNMKITSKIFLLVALGLTLLAFNSAVAFFQLNRVEHQFVAVANRDIALMEVVNKLHQQQLEQKVLFEKLKGVAEELSSPEIIDSRREYLKDYLRGLHELCGELLKRSAVTMTQGRFLLGEQSARLDDIGRGYQAYQTLILYTIDQIERGDFQLSFEHLEDFARKESILSEQLGIFLKDIEEWVAQSVAKAQAQVQSTAQLLWGVLGGSVLICGVWAWFIMAGIRKPLDNLIQATHQIGQGNFAVHLKTDSRDEIAAVSASVNQMSVQLEEFKKKLEEQNQTLTATNRELDRFVHTASHDIVGPLTAIVGYGAYLEQHYADVLDQRGKDCVAGVRKGASRMNKMVKDLLELTRVTRVKNPYALTSIKDVVEAARANCDFAINQSGCQVMIDEGLPTIVCDPIKLTIIFTNLIENAVKYSAKNDNQPKQVRVGYHRLDACHEFFVKDNGIGISPEHHQDIFDLFSRLHTRDEYDGVGAGLAIVKAAVEDHGGQVRVESLKGQGATFIFTIPNNLAPYRPII